MAKGKPVMQTQANVLPPAQPQGAPPSNQIQVTQGNVPIVLVQLLSSINTKLEFILQEMKKNG